MNKKIIYFIIFVLLIVFVILLMKNNNSSLNNVNIENIENIENNNLVQENTTIEENIVNENTSLIENKIENTTNSDNMQNTNSVQNAIVQDNIISSPEKNIYESDKDVGSTNKKQEAINLVKEYWGEDDTVNFTCDSVTSNGEYIIAVISKKSASSSDKQICILLSVLLTFPSAIKKPKK